MKRRDRIIEELTSIDRILEGMYEQKDKLETELYEIDNPDERVNDLRDMSPSEREEVRAEEIYRREKDK